jgi:hypothetical protein
MALPWYEVQETQAFKALSPSEQTAAKEQYFQQVVVPKIPKGTNLDEVRSQFFTQDAQDQKLATNKAGARKTYDPTIGMSPLDQFRAGYGQGVSNLGKGVAQKVGAYGYQDVAEDRRLDAPLSSKPTALAGNVAGNLVTTAPLMMVPGANTVVGAGAVGGALGAAQPATSMREVGSNALGGALSGSALAGGARVLPTLKRVVVDPFTQRGGQRIASDVIGQAAGRRPMVIPPSPNFVPGSTRSLAEVTENPGVAQLERSAQAKAPEVASTFDETLKARRSAQEKALELLAGKDTPEVGPIADREQVRRALAKETYGKAFSQAPKTPTLEVKAQLKELLNNKDIQSSINEAKRISANEGDAISSVGSVKGLHYLKKAIDTKIANSYSNRGEATDLTRSLMSLKGRLSDTIDALSPEYKAARDAYAQASKPLAREEFAQSLRDKLFPALHDYGATAKVTPAQFAKAVREGDSFAKKALGFDGAKVEDLLSPEEVDSLHNIARDLASQEKVSTTASVRGSPTAQYMTGGNMIRSIAGPLGLPEGIAARGANSALGRTVSSFAAPFTKGAEENLQGELARMLAAPAYYQQVRAQLAQRASNPLLQLPNYGARAAGPVGGAMAGQQPQQP